MLAWFSNPFILVVANGELAPGPWLSGYVQQAQAVVAADGGARYVLAAGGRPDVVIGDFDSLTESQWQALAGQGTELRQHPIDKDETDLELALACVADLYPDRPVLVAGVFGGRWDQSLANVMLLTQPRWRDREVTLIDADQRAWLLQGDVVISGTIGDRLSLIPLSAGVRLTTLTGLRWPLQGEVLPLGSPRGVSNELTAASARLIVHGGLLLGIQLARGWRR